MEGSPAGRNAHNAATKRIIRSGVSPFFNDWRLRNQNRDGAEQFPLLFFVLQKVLNIVNRVQHQVEVR